jgi:serine/threonine-protein kinase
MGNSAPDRGAVLEQLRRVLESPGFRRAERSSALLSYLVEETLNGRADRLKEYTLGAEGLGRGADSDPRADPVVRAEASRLRTRLDQYYGGAGSADPVCITLPKGSYVPQFLHRTPGASLGGPEPADSEGAGLGRIGRSPVIAWTCAAAAIAAATIAWGLRRVDRPEPQPPARFEVELTPGIDLASDVGTTVVLSGDGTRIVFVSRGADGRTALNTRRLDRTETTPLPGTEGARAPFLSADGRWVGFWADGKLKKIALDGGAPVVICDATDLLGATWGDDDTIIAALGEPGRLARIPAAGGAPAVVVDLTAESTNVRWPQFLPGGDTVIYTAMSGTGADRANIEAQRSQGGNRRVLVQGATFGRYLHNGYLAYVNQGTVYAVEFDPSTLVVSGPPIPLLDDVAYSPLFGYAQLDASRTGMLIYRKGAEGQRSVIDRISRSGVSTPLLSKAGHYGWMRLSPDGRQLALTTHESGIAAISVYDLKTTEMTRLTPRPGEYTGLTWLPDGQIAFGGATGLGLVRFDRPGDPVPLMTARIAQTPWATSPDGQWLAYYERSPETGFDLWTAPIRRGGDVLTVGEPARFLGTKAFEVYPSFSPDGRWMTYASNQSGTWEIMYAGFRTTERRCGCRHRAE